MIDCFRQKLGLLVLLGVTMGCAAQLQQNTAPRVADVRPDERANRQCLGSVCGPKSLMATWLFEFAPAPQDDRDSYVENRCFGAVCGPQTTTTPTWTIESSSQDCLASVCGREAVAATTPSLGPHLAQVRNTSCASPLE
ncbi:MAG TPA: hypothetical protein VKP30_14175 [Polyangiaceae bacterium]|nr:hypothetical protein [Polyangiaceae bacterium]